MILTYNQAVELMSFLPVLLSASTDVKAAGQEPMIHQLQIIEPDDAEANVYQLWSTTTAGFEVNGADFY